MLKSPLQSRHTAAEARLGARPEAPDLDAPLSFGDVPLEVAATDEGCALFDATDRGQVSVHGDAAGAFLHRIVANDVRGLAPGTGNRNLLLDPKGKVLFDFDLSVHAAEDGTTSYTISASPASTPALITAFDMYLFGEDVLLEDTTQQHAPLELVGARAGEVLERALGVPVSLERGQSLVTDGVSITSLLIAGARPGYRVDAGPGRVAELWDALRESGARPAGLVARDVLRVEACAALWGVDVDENVYPQEARLEEAISLDKGCYVGQEVVAKIDTYGGLNKRLMVLQVEHDDPVPRGTPLRLQDGEDERDLGFVTTWTYSFALDTGAILAYVKRRHQEVGTRFRLGSGSAGAAGAVAVIVEPPRPATG